MNAKLAVKKTRRFCRKYRKLLKLLLMVISAVLAIFYFMAFFSGGVNFLDAFLKKGSGNNATLYTGKDSYGDIILTVHKRSKTAIDISYQVPYNKLKTYSITLTENEKKDPELPSSYSITIQAGSGTILFDGNYRQGDPFLYSKANLPESGDIDAYRRGENPYLNFEPNLRRMVGIATGEYDQMRGSWLFLVLGAALILMVWVDVRNPLISRKIRELIIGGPSEPSDLSRVIQFFVRAVVVIVGIGFLLAAI